MVMVTDFDDFYQCAMSLFRADPSKVRYVVKYRHCHGEAVLKVTSDATCISFKFDEATNMKKLETMNMLFFSGRTTHKNRA